jgi:hypothetical protein
MRHLLVLLSACVVVSIALFAFAGSGLADPSDLFTTPVPPHRHFVQTPTGEMVPVGPQICEHPELQQAFNQFHHNVHHSFVPPNIVVHTLGPQDGAPGLHNGAGAEIVARLC